MQFAIGVDLGASNVRAGIVDEKGRVSNFKKERTSTPEKFLKFLASILDSKAVYAKFGTNLGIGIGAPGQLDLEKGKILQSPNLPSFNNFEIVPKVKNELNLPVFLERDTNVALLGEAWVGAAKKAKNVIMLTLGTGVGGAILISGKLYHGQHGLGGEMGHITIDVSGPVCTCSQKGHLEAYLGLVGVRRDYGMDHWTLIDKVEKGDEKAFEIAKRLGEILGIGLASLINVFDPEIIILGGGLSELGEVLLTPAKKIAEKKALVRPLKTKIVISQLGDFSGIIGAAKLAFSTPNSLGEFSGTLKI